MIPHPLSRLPRPISHFLGYRAPGTSALITPPAPFKKALTLTVSLVFAFAGLAVLQSVFRYDSIFTERHLPGLITSYGASAILVYGLPASPLAQPRSLIGGHFLSALTGIIIYKLFSLMPASNLAMTNWLGGALATAIALVVMDVTGTTHPPAGATAILPVVQDDIIALGWNLLWIMLLSSVLLMCVGLVGNNILGRYPVFWIRAEEFAWLDRPVVGEKEGKEKGLQNGVGAAAAAGAGVGANGAGGGSERRSSHSRSTNVDRDDDRPGSAAAAVVQANGGA